jgi:hypothetical protein
MDFLWIIALARRDQLWAIPMEDRLLCKTEMDSCLLFPPGAVGEEMQILARPEMEEWVGLAAAAVAEH